MPSCTSFDAAAMINRKAKQNISLKLNFVGSNSATWIAPGKQFCEKDTIYNKPIIDITMI